MCLRKAELVLKWSKKDQYYIGKGYKGIKKNDIDNYGFQEWQEAVTDWHCEPLEKSFEYADFNGKKYHPGFHIFLNKKDAISYNLYGLKNTNIVEVSFSDVLAYGTNENLDCDDGDGPCVVARWIRIDKILS